MPDSPEVMQFETAEGISTATASCTSCGKPLGAEYHDVNGQSVCAACRSAAEATYAADRRWSQFLVAGLYGFGAALLGGILYWGFVKITDYELGLVAIAVGWMVGKAVMKGSRGRGGRRYQVLAVTLTYLSIALSIGALAVGELLKSPATETGIEGASATAKASNDAQAVTSLAPGDAKGTSSAKAAAGDSAAAADTTKAPTTIGEALIAVGMVFLIMLGAPFLAGPSNFIGWIIIAIGLWEAWKHTKPVPFTSAGPFAIAPPDGSIASGAASDPDATIAPA